MKHPRSSFLLRRWDISTTQSDDVGEVVGRVSGGVLSSMADVNGLRSGVFLMTI
jgi:hypothetical protein